MISSTAIFAAKDIPATLAYYKDVLGFTNTWTWGEPPTFGGASMGGVSLMFSLNKKLAAKVRGHEHWIKVDDADELYALHRQRNAKVISEIADQPWGVREYVLEDLNGYRLRFAGPLSSEVPKSHPFPSDVEIVRRMPTSEEYAEVMEAAFGLKALDMDILKHSWGGVVAQTAEGRAIGMARIVRDAPAWFSAWDVGVHPNWQGHQIGTKLMEEAAAMVGEASPGAYLFLFTFKHGFYERLGFNKETVSMRRV